uniref:Uncharacterized protein n=1 Tax=Dunaliella tertiolecta TaxID=3047 RepID=A0A7S3R638_DUNTE
MQEHEEVLCAAVPALGHVLGMPTIVANKLHLDQQQQQRQQQHQQHQQQLGASESEPQGRTDTDGTPPRASSTPAPGASAAEGAGDGAMLQLECLHTLLLLLTPALHLERVRRHLAASAYPEAQPSSPGHLRDQSQGKGPCRHASPTTGQQQEQRGWALAVQRGLGWMLRSRTGATQKHSALQLAAAMTELLGPRWVLHQQLSAPPSSAKSAPSQEVPFLCVLAEILHVECSLLLHDALHAQAPVWGQAPGHRGETRDTWQPPQPSSGLVQELEERAQASMDTDCPEGAAPQLPPGEAELMSCANERPLHEHALRYAAQQAQHAATAAAPGVSQGTHEAASNQDHGSKPPADKMDQAQTAGGRAAHMLPVVLGLVEAVVEALACDAAAADAAAEDGGMEVEVEGCVSAAVAQQVMAALERIIAEVVAFLEVVAELQQQEEGVPSNGAVIRDEGLCVRQQQQQPGGQGANGTSMQEAFEVASQQKPPSAMQLVEGVCVPASMQPQLPATELVLACVRVVGRFLADVPDGHTPAMRHAMPFMLCVGSHSTPPTPALMSDGGQARDASQEGLGMWADREGTAVRFLLPGLLQATSTLSPEALELRTHITSSPPALASLVTTLCAACQHAAALAPILQGLPPAPPAPAARQPAPSKQNGPPTHPPSARKGGADTHQAPKTEQLLEGLAAAEQLLADVAMLLINLVDPTQAAPGAAAAQEGLLLGDSPQPSRSTAATCSEPGLGQTSPSGLTLGAATRALLPGLRSLGEWAELRNLPKLLSGADARGSFEGDELLPPDHAVALLSCMRLKPRALLCGGYLSGLVLHAAALQAGRSAGLQANSNEAPSGNMAVLTVLLQEGLFGEAPRGKGVDAMDWEGSAEEGIAAVQHTVQSASALLAAALKLGTSLVCGLVVEEASPGACVARAEASSSAATEHKGKGGLSGSGLGGRLRGLATLHAQLPALQADSVLADMSGDGEVCWERTAELIAHHPSLVCSFALEHSNNSSSSSSSSNERGVAQAQWTLAKWLGQLQRVQAGGGGSSGAAFREVLAQSLGLRLLLTTLRA